MRTALLLAHAGDDLLPSNQHGSRRTSAFCWVLETVSCQKITPHWAPLIPGISITQNECLLSWGCLTFCVHFVAWSTFSLVHCARGSGANGAGCGRHASGPGLPQRSHRVPFQIRAHSHRTHLLLGESQLERQDNHIRAEALWSAGGESRYSIYIPD